MGSCEKGGGRSLLDRMRLGRGAAEMKIWIMAALMKTDDDS
jgi:hypothetical protein